MQSGIDLDRLIAVSRRVQEIVGRALPGQIVKAGKSTRRYLVPDTVAGLLFSGSEQNIYVLPDVPPDFPLERGQTTP